MWLFKTHEGSLFLSSRKSELICVVLESPLWKESEYTFTKLKFQFPYCKTDKKFANGIFRNKLIQKLRHTKLNSYFTITTPISDWDTHLQEVKDNYPLYESTENSKRPPLYYLITWRKSRRTRTERCFSIHFPSVYH